MIDLELISEEEQRKIARAFLPPIEKFYENPENEKAFQKWLKAKQLSKKYYNSWDII